MLMEATSLSAWMKVPPTSAVERGVFGDLAGRGDGIAVVGAASRQHRSLHDCNVALTQLPHVCPTSGAGLRHHHAIDGDGARFRAAVEADTAPVQPIAYVMRRVHAVIDSVPSPSQHFGRAGLDTEAAALALVVADFNISSCCHLFTSQRPMMAGATTWFVHNSRKARYGNSGGQSESAPPRAHGSFCHASKPRRIR